MFIHGVKNITVRRECYGIQAKMQPATLDHEAKLTPTKSKLLWVSSVVGVAAIVGLPGARTVGSIAHLQPYLLHSGNGSLSQSDF